MSIDELNFEDYKNLGLKPEKVSKSRLKIVRSNGKFCRIYNIYIKHDKQWHKLEQAGLDNILSKTDIIYDGLDLMSYEEARQLMRELIRGVYAFIENNVIFTGITDG